MERINHFIVIIIFSLFSTISYAVPLNFSVMTGTTLPTQFLQGGGTDRGIYIVKNLTSGVRINNYVAHLPKNVLQVTQDTNTASLCAPIFTLQPKGLPGDSCALELNVGSSVNGNDPNQFNHVFVCLKDRTTCVGPVEQLNVASTNAVVVGEYSTGVDPSLPFLMVINSNNAWQFIDVTKIDGVPDFAPILNELSSASCFGNACVVGGSYSESDGTLIPLLLVSHTQGQSWTNIDTTSIINTPAFGAVNGINKISCANLPCVAAGVYQDSTQTRNLPLLFASQNQGLSWTFIDVTQVNNAPFFVPLGNCLSSTECHGSTCLAVGSYGTGNSSGGTSRSNISANPLLLTSNNNGRTWSFINVSTIAGVPTFGDSNFNELHDASCNDNACIVVGNFTSSDNLFILPLILVSNKQGLNWSFINPSTIANIPAGTFVGDNELTNVSCSNAVCVASGYYSVPSTGNLFPLLLVSNNNGRSWRFIDTTALSGIPTFGGFNLLYSSSCSGEICSASGNYSTTGPTPVTLPLLFQSKNSGRTWAYIDTTLAFRVPTYGAYNNFYNTICFGTNVCAVVGDYLTNDSNPLMLITNAANNILRGNGWANLSPLSIKNYPAVTSGTLTEIATTS